MAALGTTFLVRECVPLSQCECSATARTGDGSLPVLEHVIQQSHMLVDGVADVRQENSETLSVVSLWLELLALQPPQVCCLVCMGGSLCHLVGVQCPALPPPISPTSFVPHAVLYHHAERQCSHKRGTQALQQACIGKCGHGLRLAGLVRAALLLHTSGTVEP